MIVVRRFTGAGRNYLWVLHTQTGKEFVEMKAAAQQSGEQANVLSNKMGFGVNRITTHLECADDGSIPYDVFTGKPLPVLSRANRRMTITVEVPKWEGTLIAFLPQRPRALSLTLPRAVSAGQPVRLQMTVLGTRGTVDAYFPLHVTVTDPNNNVNIEYSRRLLATHGKADDTFTFAKNDVPGVWKISVVDAFTGIHHETQLVLKAR